MTTPEEAATVLLWRRRHRRSFEEFVRHCTTESAPVAHHLLVMQKLQNVADGKTQRLALFLPPGHAKSFYASIMFPPWFLGRFPSKRFIAASHTADLAEYFGRRCRTVLQTPEYFSIFQAGLDDKTKAAGQWNTARGAEYFAVGVGGAVTGRRGDVGLIDDPIKGREDADSENIRNKTWEWYKADFRTRLKPDAAIILISTRWHEADLAGQIFGEGYGGESGLVQAVDGETWEVLSLPALAEEDDPMGRARGEPLWPGYYTLEKLHQERISQGARNWAALYQQRPAPQEGNFFKREWIRYYDKKPQNLRIYAASDFAITKKRSDHTVHGICGIDENDDLYILDWWRGQTESLVWAEKMIELAQFWKPLEWGEEAGLIRKSVDPFITKLMSERKVYFYRNPYPSTTDKTSRAQAFQGRMAQGKVYFPQNAVWLDSLEHEILTFPAGKNDDQVDVCSLFGRMLGRMSRATAPRKAPVPKTIQTITWDELWASQTRRLGGRRV